MRRSIIKRKWIFERGLVYYLVEGARVGRNWTISVNELLKLMEAVE